MNYNIPNLPYRTQKPRENGITMVMDKGLSLSEAANLISSSEHLIDYVKLGFGTSFITAGLKDKINLYKKNNIKVYFGGTLFEAFYIRKATKNYESICYDFGIEVVEISDGSININHDEKLNLINNFSKNFTVLSEVGSKNAEVVLSDETWVFQLNSELKAGSKFVIAEAREGGNVGIYEKNGKPKTDLITSIIENTDISKILWEAPEKSQQVYFIKNFGTNVNLGNIAPNEVIALETLRLGLRGDTFSILFKNVNT